MSADETSTTKNGLVSRFTDPIIPTFEGGWEKRGGMREIGEKLYKMGGKGKVGKSARAKGEGRQGVGGEGKGREGG